MRNDDRMVRVLGARVMCLGLLLGLLIAVGVAALVATDGDIRW